tara:strand:- start:1704 stop:2270 length:567 start_codon:yes stop_codon:yes gene_type:complete
MYPITGGVHIDKMIVAGIVTFIVAFFIMLYFMGGKSKSGLLVQTSSKKGKPTDYVWDNIAYKTGNIMMSPAQLANYYNLTYPPDTTKFVPGANGKGSCAVSSVNNAPWDSYYKCNNSTWSKDAIGEALALSSVGSYYLPSGPEDANLHKVVALAHDPTTWGCADAGGVKPYNNTNKALAGVIPPGMRE